MGKRGARMEKVCLLDFTAVISAEFFDPKPTQLQMACSNVGAAAGFGNVVEIALGIWDIQIDSGRKLALFHGDEGGGHAGGSAGSLSVANLRFQPRHGNLFSMIAQARVSAARVSTRSFISVEVPCRLTY